LIALAEEAVGNNQPLDPKAYDNIYFFEFSGRYDGSSRFAKGNRWGFFPSFSAGPIAEYTYWTH